MGDAPPLAPGLGALCQVGRVLRREVVCGMGVVGLLLEVFWRGESFTYGNIEVSSLPDMWSC